ncbi:MAG: ribbon-helix-helix domain-containing protein [Thermoproteales archaeon]|nr:ribbon-helix-helix domain-containing protein [Thermoproteales archaeon]
MPNITLSIPNDIYKKMKEYSEIKWSEVVRKAIIEYLEKLEKNKLEVSTKKLLEELGSEFRKELEKLELEKAIKEYRKMRSLEWKRLSMIQVD